LRDVFGVERRGSYYGYANSLNGELHRCLNSAAPITAARIASMAIPVTAFTHFLYARGKLFEGEFFSNLSFSLQP
jgi:hypothetical protein